MKKHLSDCYGAFTFGVNFPLNPLSEFVAFLTVEFDPDILDELKKHMVMREKIEKSKTLQIAYRLGCCTTLSATAGVIWGLYKGLKCIF